MRLATAKAERHLSNRLQKIHDEYVCQAEDADIIVLAKSTGALEFTTGTYGQEICVSSIIKGNEWIDENETCWICAAMAWKLWMGKLCIEMC